MDEPQAIAQLKQGDLTGLEFLVRQYQAKAIHTAYLIVGDADLAQDIVQIAFMRIVRKIEQFDSQRSFQPWFLRVVINDAIKAAHGQQRTVSINTTTQATLDWLRDTGPKPEELAENNDLRQVVWHALQQLAPEQRAVIVQRHFLEMSEAEMVENPSTTGQHHQMVALQRPKKPESPFGNRKL